MKKNICTYIAVGAMLLSSCMEGNSVIKGTVVDGGKNTVYLDAVGIYSTETVDSLTLPASGKFSFKVEVENPEFYRVRISPDKYVYVLAQKDSTVTLSLKNGANFSSCYEVSGTRDNTLLKKAVAELDKNRKSIDSLYSVISGTEDKTVKEEAVDSIYTYLNAQRHFAKEFILANPESPVSYFVLYQKILGTYVLNRQGDYTYYRTAAEGLEKSYPDAQYSKFVKKHAEKMLNDIRVSRLQQMMDESGSDLPRLSLPDANGKIIDLENFRGKTILLDFAALTAPGAEAYINNLKEIYKKYSSQGLVIIQVCFDPSKLLWESAIKQMGINWYCLRDEEGENSRTARLWNVSNIPSNYIINKDFKIAGKNLEGRNLSDRIKDVLK